MVKDMITVRLVHGDMWEGLYINGKVVYQNHRVEIPTFWNYLKEEAGDAKMPDIDFKDEFCNIDWLEDYGCFPDDYKDILF